MEVNYFDSNYTHIKVERMTDYDSLDAAFEQYLDALSSGDREVTYETMRIYVELLKETMKQEGK